MSNHVDVLIIGAGLSGIGAGAQLAREQSRRSYQIWEARSASGGTWDLFRYPGVRSDSDMFTLGYRFKPWQGGTALADGPSILDYVRETAQENDVDRHIHYDHSVIRAEWDSAAACWTVTALHHDQEVVITCSLLWSCSGYYDYDAGYTPEFPGLDNFQGRVVHPQFWPDDLDYAGKRVVVIGSGATAVTLVPAMAESAALVTMLQRSPTYILPMPQADPIVNGLRALLPERAAYVASRWKNVMMSTGIYELSQRRPKVMRRVIRKLNAHELPEGYDVDTHFNPTYDPWDQRLCLVPDGDLFKAISSGRADVVTDTIETFTERGIKLASGGELEADIIITATGLALKPFGGIRLVVDGTEVHLPDTMSYRALMLSGVPNFIFTVGYTNASWTLKADLVAQFVCRLLDYLGGHGYRSVVPVRDPSVAAEPFMDFSAGYVVRALDRLPKQGSREPWKLRQNYLRDIRTIRHGDLDDGVLRFE
jgi:monooxygenase